MIRSPEERLAIRCALVRLQDDDEMLFMFFV